MEDFRKKVEDRLEQLENDLKTRDWSGIEVCRKSTRNIVIELRILLGKPQPWKFEEDEEKLRNVITFTRL